MRASFCRYVPSGTPNKACHSPGGMSTRVVPGNSTFKSQPDLGCLEVRKAALYVIVCKIWTTTHGVVVTLDERRYEKAS